MDSPRTVTKPEEVTLTRRRELPLWVGVWGQVVKRKPLAAFGLAIVALLLIVGIFADFIAPEGLNEPHPDRVEALDEAGRKELVGPSFSHPFGLDNLGRDVLSRVIFGARVSMLVALGTVALGTGLGTVVGMLSSWLGGKADTFIQRIVDGMMVFPWLVVLIVIVTMLPNQSPVPFLSIFYWAMAKVIFSLGILNIAWISRVVRSAAMATKENQYVDAARALGGSGWRINLRHILPNIMAPIITIATLGLGFAILSEATLSFLGHGIPPPFPSWGGMLTTTGQQYLHRAPWLAIFPGVMIILVVFGINVLGDGLRDLLDPRLKGKSGRFGA
ncbi:MAG: ABC transporter permease [Dehalococcoidia bacterium]